MRVMGMNFRNVVIKQLNPPESLFYAKDKLSFKEKLSSHGLKTARTFFTIKQISDIHSVSGFPAEFVIKPNKGFGGKGILLLEKKESAFYTPVGDVVSFHFVKLHIEKILDGQFSMYSESDSVIVEERLYPSMRLMFKGAVGVPDIRIICVKDKPMMAMLRYPTIRSVGRANLSAGALGIGIDMATGALTRVYSKEQHKGHPISYLEIPEGFKINNWDLIKRTAAVASKLSGLGFSGIDIVIDRNEQIVVLEANGYPGLEIQNVNRTSLM